MSNRIIVTFLFILGVACLEVLNDIIVGFDKLLFRQEFSRVEKIKVNATLYYLITSSSINFFDIKRIVWWSFSNFFAQVISSTYMAACGLQPGRKGSGTCHGALGDTRYSRNSASIGMYNAKSKLITRWLVLKM